VGEQATAAAYDGRRDVTTTQLLRLSVGVIHSWGSLLYSAKKGKKSGVLRWP
jgi:hypothetical protein